MAELILHKDGAYNIYTTVADCACYESALTLDELKEAIRFSQGETGLRDLPQRLERAHKSGCSSMLYVTLEECILCNRAGENESELSMDDFVAKYLTLAPSEIALSGDMDSGAKPKPPAEVASVRIVANLTPAAAAEWRRRGRTGWLRDELRKTGEKQ